MDQTYKTPPKSEMQKINALQKDASAKYDDYKKAFDEGQTMYKDLNETKNVVTLTKQSVESPKKLAEALNMPYVLDRWIGGTLTNYKIINSRVKKLEELEKATKSGELDKYTKKERMMFNKELQKMSVHFEGLKKLTRMPDAVFVSSLKESALPIKESQKMGIKTLGIANTDSNPDDMDYVIPANDRSKKSVDLIMEIIKNELINNKG